MKKARLDELLIERHLAESLEKARALIGAGLVLVNGSPADKAGSRYSVDSSLELKQTQRYVSRGGLKLEAGLQAFDIDPTGLVCADIGCSTGGFTDCLLQHGAQRVYCVDVGYGLLDWRLRGDNRVVLLERTNARHLTNQLIPEPLALVVIDASFISLALLIKPVMPLFGPSVRIIALVKPQFELPKDKVARGGVVLAPDLHELAQEMVRGYAQEAGLECRGVIASPIRGAKGNQEFLMYLQGSFRTDESGNSRG